MITELQNHIEPCLNYCALTDIWKASDKATHDFVSADDIEFYGSTLLRFAVEQKGIRKVDVNEQNTRASYFYKNHGFSVTGRDDTDAEGMPYPILHLELTEDK